jgi:hypothetical protein
VPFEAGDAGFALVDGGVSGGAGALASLAAQELTATLGDRLLVTDSEGVWSRCCLMPLLLLAARKAVSFSGTQLG